MQHLNENKKSVFPILPYIFIRTVILTLAHARRLTAGVRGPKAPTGF